MEFTRYSKICAKTFLKINCSVETPWHKRVEVARYGLWVPVWLLHVWYFASTSDAMLLHFRCALISGYPFHNDGQYENRSKSRVRPFNHYRDRVFHEATTAIIFPCLRGVSLQLFVFRLWCYKLILCFDMVRNSGCCKYSFKIKLHEILIKVMGKNQKKRT